MDDFIEICGWERESGSRCRAIAHLSDDKTVAKMGHPILFSARYFSASDCLGLCLFGGFAGWGWDGDVDGGDCAEGV